MQLNTCRRRILLDAKKKHKNSRVIHVGEKNGREVSRFDIEAWTTAH
jgi:hypothetical protein